MEKNDILCEALAIKNIIAVIKGHNANCRKPLKRNGRPSDAFVYILSGSCSYQFDDGTAFTVHAGDLFYLPYQSVYTMYIYDSNYKFIFCDFEFSDTSAKKPAVYTEGTEHMDGLFANLLHCYQVGTAASQADCMSVLYHIYGLLIKCAKQENTPNNQDNRISAAKAYIDEHYGNCTLAISALAEMAGISEVYFRKLFKEKYRISPAKYLISARLGNAKKLMRYDFLSIEDCALQSGFSSAQYFCRVFKKEVGISPGEYKRSICP